MSRFLCLLLALAVRSHAEKPPNIVFILTDDLGITDVNGYARHFTGAKDGDLFYETPNIDKLIADGMAFSQSYANQLCSPPPFRISAHEVTPCPAAYSAVRDTPLLGKFAARSFTASSG